jgi:5'-3' exoribonuclease 1
MPKELEEIWIEVFNYINTIVDLLKPTKTIVLALDGVAPRCKMNNQRSRRFRSAQDYKEFLKQFYGYTDLADSQENFKNNSISPGTKFMSQLNEMIHFFLLKKIEEDNYWKRLSIVFTGSDTPGEGEHKIMEYIRANNHQFHPDDTHCLYGADADLIMLGLTLPLKNICIIREEYVHTSDKVQIMSARKEKEINF